MKDVAGDPGAADFAKDVAQFEKRTQKGSVPNSSKPAKTLHDPVAVPKPDHKPVPEPPTSLPVPVVEEEESQRSAAPVCEEAEREKIKNEMLCDQLYKKQARI